jgi:hypothetical protein
MSDFGDAFRTAMERLGYGEPPERRLSPAQVSQLAMDRAGTTDKKTRAYKSARRTLERRRTTGKQARGQHQRRFAHQVRQRGLNVHAELDLDIESDEEHDERPRSFDVTIPGSRLGRCADALERSDLDAAAEAFKVAMLREYEEVEPGEPSHLAAAEIGEVGALDVEFADEPGDPDEMSDYSDEDYD